MSGGAGDDGLIQRFGLLVWPDQAPQWESVDRHPNSAARQAAWDCFVSLDGLDPGAIGAEPTSPFQSVPILRLDAEAHDLFLEWRKDLERNLRSGDLHPALASHFAKYRKLVPTLALINHLADVGHGPVGEDAMMRALGLATYLETHARRAYGAGPEAETAAAKAILSHIPEGQSQRRLFRERCAPAWLVEPERSGTGPGGPKSTLRPRLDCCRGNGEPGPGQANHPLQHQPEGPAMTGYRNKYLEMLKAEKSKKPPGDEPSKTLKNIRRRTESYF